MKDSSEKVSRRTVMQRMGWAGGGLWALGSSGLLQPGTALAAFQPVSTGTVALELDGGITWVNAFEGGNAVADVLAEARGPDVPTAKRLGGYRYEDLVLKVPLDGSTTFTSWISESLGKGSTTRSGAIVFLDLAQVEWKRLEFSNAIISEVALPNCDAGGKDPMLMTIRLTPEATRWSGGSGKSAQTASARLPTRVTTSAFRLNIQGLEAATPFVSKIEGLGVKRVTQAGAVGQRTPKQLQGAALDAQPITLILPESRAALFYNWFESFVIKGSGATGAGERPGLLEWLTPNLSTVVASVQLQNLGIVRYAPVPFVSGTSDKTSPIQVELYCEQMTFALAK